MKNLILMLVIGIFLVIAGCQKDDHIRPNPGPNPGPTASCPDHAPVHETCDGTDDFCREIAAYGWMYDCATDLFQMVDPAYCGNDHFYDELDGGCVSSFDICGAGYTYDPDYDNGDGTRGACLAGEGGNNNPPLGIGQAYVWYYGGACQSLDTDGDGAQNDLMGDANGTIRGQLGMWVDYNTGAIISFSETFSGAPYCSSSTVQITGATKFDYFITEVNGLQAPVITAIHTNRNTFAPKEEQVVRYATANEKRFVMPK